VDAANAELWTPLHLAAAFGHRDTLQELIE
jgi:ankyrin repeat protein